MIVLDTHALLWWVSGDARLSTATHQAIERELDRGAIVISSISLWEIAMLIERGRLALSMDLDAWLATVGEIDAVRFFPVDNDIALQSVRLPGDFHEDPADRFIVSTARRLAAPLVTADEKIRTYPHVQTIW
ncbi:type II toxin-antitoxin system VapC family toxin [Tepidimonas taiwanensis]|uniref:Ribonuclease VapC22 n=1 Tax=Tepidimonas taiwanensis TaxID=307486 RepID=A0A554X229_9BURK|nr:type II toxin-antitoxin system VapC family toxin [Tepidimonas taiwanensis]MCX7693696.1 type II toxin-antitoxin system VapC family toxin [Tepidimonas taiwanensis]MDM7463698.1 type II toxin-antitoxin system VapC family toxin [Tepidimonas taiwanensis]TSE29816.1 Ribonuclease VapC22 [Tepidimonas taiwanensis]UBQ04571.1 type II toxin-antitoxin system VapC family toxin [Tepidimonas taiwanensis]